MSSYRFSRQLLLLTTTLLVGSCDSSTDPTANDPPEPAAVASVVVVPAPLDLLLREATQLAVIAHDAEGNELPDRAATFSSSNLDVVTVDTAGMVTGVGEGSATITVVVEGVETTIAATVSVLVFASISAGGSSDRS